MNPQPIDPDTRRLFLAALENEAKGFTGFAEAIRDLLRLRVATLRRLPAIQPERKQAP